MNKQQLVKAMAIEASMTQDEATVALNGLLAAITKAMADGEEVKLVGFGTFSVAARKGRTGRNPKTGEAVEIPAKNIAKFKAGKDLQEAVNYCAQSVFLHSARGT